MFRIYNKYNGHYLDRVFPDKASAKKWFEDNNLSKLMYKIVRYRKWIG